MTDKYYIAYSRLKDGTIRGQLCNTLDGAIEVSGYMKSIPGPEVTAVGRSHQAITIEQIRKQLPGIKLLGVD